MDEVESQSEKKEPWWNDQEKVGGLVSTIIMLTLLAVIVIFAVGFAVKLAFG
jgi:hypothetical protein